ncbi:hypothetical protein ACWDSJ_00560 [Nocardia sp. NPDC003482]|uniref:hypothetical protein n=1 Tax=Nocardia sp. NPDC004068 TaxID=3364303 RepID=UPI003677A4C5
MTTPPPRKPDHSREPESIRAWLCALESEAGTGFHIERELRPPYGWNLVEEESGSVVCTGSLDKLDEWLHKCRPDDR